MIPLFCTILATPLIAVAAAAAVSSPVGDLTALLVPFQRRGLGLHARQTFLVPNYCDPICDPVLAIINGCPTAACACTTENANGFIDCIDCAITGVPTTANIHNAQSALNNYLNGCAAGGVPLTAPTLTPNPPSVTGPTSQAPLGNPTTEVPFTSGFGGPPSSSSVSATTSTPNAPKSTLSNGGGGTTPTTAAPVTSQPSQSASGPPLTSGATGVGNRAEVMSMLFSLCLMVTLLA